MIMYYALRMIVILHNIVSKYLSFCTARSTFWNLLAQRHDVNLRKYKILS